MIRRRDIAGTSSSAVFSRELQSSSFFSSDLRIRQQFHRITRGFAFRSRCVIYPINGLEQLQCFSGVHFSETEFGQIPELKQLLDGALETLRTTFCWPGFFPETQKASDMGVFGCPGTELALSTDPIRQNEPSISRRLVFFLLSMDGTILWILTDGTIQTLPWILLGCSSSRSCELC